MFRNSRILVLFCFLAMSCGGGNPAPSGRTSSLIAQAPPSITGLEGYTAGLVREPVFGGEVYVVEAGPEDGLPLVLVHGLGKGGARDWYGLLPGLAEKYRVLAFDLPGFGASTKENELYSPSRYVDFIKWITSERIGGQFDLLGHSMGATLSLLYAGTHPGDIKHLILADAACILDRHVLMSYMAENNLAGPRILKERLGGVVGFMAPIFMEISEDFAPDLRSLIETEASREKWLGGDSARIAALALVLEDVNREIDNITSPTMLIWGREDTVAPLRTGRIVAKRIPGAKLRFSKGWGTCL